MAHFIIINIYLFVLAVVLAILEIQIEGPHGWAKNLPTWRPNTKNKFIGFYVKLMSGREPTGYHMTIFTFVLLILHMPYVFGEVFNIENWLMTISTFFMFIVLWDFLWFVMNPYHPLKNFSKEHIWWHKKWWGRAPSDYYMSVILSLVVVLPIAWHHNSWLIVDWWLLNICLFAAETILVALFTLYILKIDNWKKHD